MVRDVRHRSDDAGGSLLEIWKLQDYDTGSWSLDYRVDLRTDAGVPAADGAMARRPAQVLLVTNARRPSSPPGAARRAILLADSRPSLRRCHAVHPAGHRSSRQRSEREMRKGEKRGKRKRRLTWILDMWGPRGSYADSATTEGVEAARAAAHGRVAAERDEGGAVAWHGCLLFWS
uniref:Uncharacterized protein n=1 Tax=Oryza barthii TaxID=65489 RepID=A0A0D3FS16_9ORYZ